MSAAIKFDNIDFGKRGAVCKRPSPKWVPKKWRPEYEVIVAMDSMGMSRDNIIKEFFRLSGTLYTPQHITNICNCPEALQIKQKRSEQLREGQTLTIQDRLEQLKHKALNRVERIIENDEIFDKSPFAVVDRAFKVLELGKPSTTNGGLINNNFNNTLVISEEAARILADGTNKANEVKALFSEVPKDESNGTSGKNGTDG